MARPYSGYTLDGEKIPSVTTILSRFKESGGLIHWAWQQGVDGKDYRETRDEAASAGHLAHQMVECDIRKKLFERNGHSDETLDKAYQSFAAYLEWKEQTQLVPVESEVSLISKAHKYGGTLDAMLVRGKLSLGDWKTANALYQDNLIQLAAYAILWEENHPDRPIEGGFHLLRFSKEEGDFAHHWFGNLDDAKRAFILMRELFDIDKKLKARVK